MAFSICMCIIFCHALIILSLIQKSRLSKIHLKCFFWSKEIKPTYRKKFTHYAPSYLLPRISFSYLTSTPHAHAADKLERGAHVRHLRVKQAKPFNPSYWHPQTDVEGLRNISFLYDNNSGYCEVDEGPKRGTHYKCTITRWTSGSGGHLSRTGYRRLKQVQKTTTREMSLKQFQFIQFYLYRKAFYTLK